MVQLHVQSISQYRLEYRKICGLIILTYVQVETKSLFQPIWSQRCSLCSARVIHHSITPNFGEDICTGRRNFQIWPGYHFWCAYSAIPRASVVFHTRRVHQRTVLDYDIYTQTRTHLTLKLVKRCAEHLVHEIKSSESIIFATASIESSLKLI
jgi:hypothetical protein